MHCFKITNAPSTVRSIQWALPIAGLLSCLFLSGCGLPRSGPWMEEISDPDGAASMRLVEVTPDVAAATRVAGQASFPEALLRQPVVDASTLTTGDGVDVTIWESDELRMFPPGPTGAAQLGEVVIDQAGDMYLPYLGRIPAAGHSLASLRELISLRLRGLIISFDVELRLTDRKGKFVVVQGDVAKPGTYPIEQSTRRLSGLLSLAAPNAQQPELLAVTHVRDGQAHSVRLADIYLDPLQDIALYPEDKIIAATVNEHAVVLGAAGVQGRVALSTRNYSVIDALGEAHGLNDATAYPKGVYVLRRTPADDAGSMTTLYHFDLTRPDQLASAGLFRISDGDLLYISDAPYTKVQKVMSVFGGVVSGAGNAVAR